MRFPLINTGRRFFFFTFAVDGRRPVLSRLERGEKRPILLPDGERVVALWRRLHEIEPHFTASDFVIMPDHVHLLLIVNSEGEFKFNPLVFAHWFLQAAEGPRTTGACRPRTPAVNEGAAGEGRPRPPAVNEGAAGLATPAVGEGAKPPWVKAPQDWWHYCGPQTLAASRAGGSGVSPVVSGGSGVSPVVRNPPSFVWSRDFWIDITFDARQLAAVRRYILMNPARYFWKLDHPDMFKFHADLRHPALNPALAWSAVGDITILASPFLYLVRLTMKKTAAELEDEIAAHVERASQGWTPVCGFISAGEREFERRLKALPHSRWIKTVPYGLPERYDPSVEDSRWLAARRQLVLSSFDRADIPPFKVTRPGCLAMNERIAAMVRTTGACRPRTPAVGESAAGEGAPGVRGCPPSLVAPRRS